ncbi:hypothetical protein [Thiocystis violascens]|uniref:Uncharacterized protein n=1 Tax=Thiocystis violascens (strain ATCC 17096 / DSM 198 / 6111) TaxID=765911 RepID=I3YFE4_THIV6|nr:hypothetical protein [Thiocystis violascens]AFL75712.1 hypothetical protein Thivi_3872 [Thiocystis violascens DSM 198]
MTTLIALLLWLTLFGLAAWRPELTRRWGARLALAAVSIALGLSPFWRDVAWTVLSGRDWPLAGPETAFLSVWMLVLLPVLQRRLDADTFVVTLFSGLVAAAALGTALDISHLALALFDAESWSGPGATALVFAIVVILSLAGGVLCLLARPEPFPWDYPAWYAGLLTMTQAAEPLPIGIAFDVGEGVWALGGALAIAALVWRYGRLPSAA